MSTVFDDVCAVLSAIQSGRLNPSRLQPLPWEDIFKVAAGHSVLAPIAEGIRAHHVTGVADQYEEFLREYPRRVRAKNKFLAQELSRVQGLLENAGVVSLTFKGPVLAKHAYGGLSRRTCSDIDLLIPPHCFNRVQELLEAQGYHLNTYIYGRFRQRIRRYFNRQYTFTRGQAVFHLDVHTAITSPRYGYAPTFSDMMERSWIVDAEGIRLRAFSTEDMVLAACYQGLKDRWRKLKHVLDIDRLVRTEAWSWPTVLALAREFQAVRTLFVGLRLASRLFDTPLPLALNKKVVQDKASEATCDWAIKAMQAWPEEPTESLAERIRLYAAIQDNVMGILRYSGYGALRKVWHLYEQAYLARR